MKFLLIGVFVLLSSAQNLIAQDMTQLVLKVKEKIDQVKDYTATGTMKTDVAFIKAPIGKVQVFFKQPNLFKLQKDRGISILPKGGVSINMNSIIASEDFTAFAAGETVVNGVKTRIVKVLPLQESSDIVLTTMYIDETNLLVRKATTTTKENGTYEMEMQYGKFANYSLPDKIIFSFNTKDYKLPKGITLEFDDEKPKEKDPLKNKKGKVEIKYDNYIINKGIPSSVFKM